MKKRLAKWFLLVAKRLDPCTHIENAQVVEEYEAKKIGLTYEVSRKDINAFRFKDGAKLSVREGERGIICDVKNTIRRRIIASIDINRLIEYEIKRVNGGFRVSGELKVYVPKSENDGEEK